MHHPSPPSVPPPLLGVPAVPPVPDVPGCGPSAMAAKKSSVVNICPGEQYEAFVQLVADMKDFENIRDSSLAMVRLLGVCTEYLDSRKGETA